MEKGFAHRGLTLWLRADGRYAVREKSPRGWRVVALYVDRDAAVNRMFRLAAMREATA